MDKYLINIAEDFSEIPGARYYDDGDFSGQEFREKFLEKEFDKYDVIEINLDGTEGYATSFLEEAFGGLVRIVKDKEKVLTKLTFISTEEPNLIEEIMSYIKEAKVNN